jgi:hypothetical protein
MNISSQILLSLFSIAVVASIISIYWRFVVLQDFVILNDLEEEVIDELSLIQTEQISESFINFYV